MAATELFLERQQQPEVGQQLVQYGTDEELLELWRKCKRESFLDRWIWERGWMRNIHYVNNRHWIEYHRRTNEWRDVRLAKWFPKPVTPLISVGVQALRSMFASVNIGVNVRPNGSDPANVAVAAIADEYAPVLHREHDMDAVLNEHDFWFIVTGNAFLHTFFERDARHGTITIDIEQCVACGQEYSTLELVDAGQVCPHCGATKFQPAVDPLTNLPKQKRISKGRGVTVALSPFEVAFPSTYARFEDVPYVIRLRWRSKEYYESHPTLAAQTKGIKWGKAPSETSLQLFRSLPFHNDMGVAPFLGTSTGNGEEEGAPEYEVWFRPCERYPEGLVFRVVGDSNPIILHLEDEEAIPGPIPYRDADGQPLFTWTHSGFEHRGGRIWASSPMDGAIQKQNQLNQLDAFILMIINRMSNPLWLVPKGAEIEKFTGEPGLVVKWNPLTVGGAAKPERVDGLGPNAALFTVREQFVRDIEEALGTYDVVKGTKPVGVEAFAALQLLVERSQSRFASAFRSRGRSYENWFKAALEIEREFGPDERTEWVMNPARGWTRKLFKRAQLKGSFQVVVEEGSQTPKTQLGMRAAVQQLDAMGALNKSDPDQLYSLLQLFGQTKLAPSLDIHMQRALAKQQEFEDWVLTQNPQMLQMAVTGVQMQRDQYAAQIAAIEADAQAQTVIDPASGQAVGPDPAPMIAQLQAPPSLTEGTPLKWKRWYKADIHLQEFMKWANSDRMMDLVKQNPAIEPILEAHLEEITMALQEQAMMFLGTAPAPNGGGGAGMAMANSNQEAGGLGVMPGQPGAAQEPT